MWARLRQMPIASSAFATAIAAIAVLAIAQVTRGDAVGRAFYDVDPTWIALLALAGLIVYPAYVLAYRSIACIHGHAPLALPLVARVVVAGFGPFSIGGGFGFDKQALHALHEDERSARVRVLALGMLEWAVLAPVACGVAVALLVTGARIEGALLWPWAIGVPLGFGCALWVSTPGRLERLRGGRFERLVPLLEGVGALHTLIRAPRRYAGAWIGTTLYWAADIGAFYGALRAFGLDPSGEIVILAYATGYAATRRSLPLGGAGITEALMIYSLSWLGQPLAPAIAAVVAYRVFNFLLVATPALIARRQMEPLLQRADWLRRRERRERALRRAKQQ
ncbi:MAG: lysylphosphatidylglycerol synthase transmembrane domain-containing protein [Solirubrobacteraceae bacterium]